MKKAFIIPLLALYGSLSACAKSTPLDFRATGESRELIMPDSTVVRYTAYSGIRYVTNVEDTTYQTLNFFVPEGATQRSPILLRTYVGGYMAARAQDPSAFDATGRALREGMCVCIPGSRGNNSMQGGVYTGKAPRGLLDLKAAVRYLRLNDKRMLGSAERIVTDGTSAGGAMSALLGATANHPDYEPLLRQMGAAQVRDDVYAAVCYCPITDLDHADVAYEWLFMYNRPDVVKSQLQGTKFNDYINSLGLKNPKDNTPLDYTNYMDYLKSYLIASAQRFVNEGGEISDSLGFHFLKRIPHTPTSRRGGPRFVRAMAQKTDVINDVDMRLFLSYVVSRHPLKDFPAFDNLDSPECQVFGNEYGVPAHFTGENLGDELQKRIRMMNPMNYIRDPKATVAPHWYIRHGALDRDTSFPIPVNLATMLMNQGRDVNFALPWNRSHSGDYNLDDLFRWLKTI